MKTFLGDWFAAFFLVAVVYVLVRPQSRASEAVTLFAKGMAAIVSNVTDM